MNSSINEIKREPEILREIISKEKENIIDLANTIKDHTFHQFVITARGRGETSAQAYGKYLFDIMNHYIVSFAPPSVYTLYNSPQKMDSALLIALCQSGEESDVVRVISEAREQGGITVAVTNNLNSQLAKEAEFVIETHTSEIGKEGSIADCVAQKFILSILSSALNSDQERLNLISETPDKLELIFDIQDEIDNISEQLEDIQVAACVGRGFNYSAALEISYELKEFAGVFSEASSSADFVRGPISMVKSNFPVFVFAPKGKTLPPLIELTKDLNQRKAKTIVISDDSEILSLSDLIINLPISLDEMVSPLLSVMTGQLLIRRFSDRD